MLLAGAGRRPITWPDGRQFAFTIVDDTDCATVENVGPVYQFLIDQGILTTKTVWPLAPAQKPVKGGGTLEERRYRDWVLDLQRHGVEIAFHGATDHSSPRERTVQALDYFRDVLARDPRIYAAHTGQIEGMYWGESRLDGSVRAVYRAVHRLKRIHCSYEGHVKRSPYFWGDICRDRVTYMRNLAFKEINTLRQDPMMPYHDPRRPYVRYWFSSSDGSKVGDFCELLSEVNQDRLLEEGGACIAYVHFAYGFMEGQQIHREFARLMRRLAALPGWFVPASTLLDHLKARPDWTGQVDQRVLRRMQWKWLGAKLRNGRS